MQIDYGLIGIIAQGVGTYLTASGAKKVSQAEQATYQYSSVVAKNNAALTQLQITQEQLIGGQRWQAIANRAADVRAKQRVALGANGVDLNAGGTAQELIASTDVAAQSDFAINDSNTKARIAALEVQQQGFLAEAAVNTKAKKAITPSSSFLAAALPGVAQVASSWYKRDESLNGVQKPKSLFDWA